LGSGSLKTPNGVIAKAMAKGFSQSRIFTREEESK